MAWANQHVFHAVAALPSEALTSYSTDASFTVARILQHTVQAAEWYVYCANGTPWQDRVFPVTGEDVRTLASELADLDAVLLRESSRPDVVLTIEDEYGRRENALSTVLAQAIYHATEHRAQLVSALECRGFTTINLDELDLWAFERAGSS